MTPPPVDIPDADRRAPLPALASIAAVAGFQLARLLTPPRLALAAIGIVFPTAVLAAAVNGIGTSIEPRLGFPMLYLLIPEMVCMLGLLVTMSPLVADELERGTWVHVAVRPGGRRGLLLGTWLASVIWSGAVALAALGLAILSDCIEGGSRVAGSFAVLILLSCMGRAALFALPAVIVPKRALVATVGVALVIEYFAGLIPAVVNQFTVSLRLRTLLVTWTGLRREIPSEFQLLVDINRPWYQVCAVLVLTTVFLAIAWAILEWRQFPPSDES